MCFLFSRIRRGNKSWLTCIEELRNYTMVFRMGIEEFRHLFRDHHHGDQRDGFNSYQMGKENEEKSGNLLQKSYQLVG